MKCQDKFTVKKDQKVFLVVSSDFDYQAQFIIYFVYLKKNTHNKGVYIVEYSAWKNYRLFSIYKL